MKPTTQELIATLQGMFSAVANARSAQFERDHGNQREALRHEEALDANLTRARLTLSALKAPAPAPARLNFAQTVDRIKREIRADIADGVLPPTVSSYADLHDFVDANGYGGAFDPQHDPSDQAQADFWEAAHDAVDKWLQNGRKTPEVPDPVQALEDVMNWWANTPSGDMPAAIFDAAHAAIKGAKKSTPLLGALKEATVLLTYCAEGEPMGPTEVWDAERLEETIQICRNAIEAAEARS